MWHFSHFTVLRYTFFIFVFSVSVCTFLRRINVRINVSIDCLLGWILFEVIRWRRGTDTEVFTWRSLSRHFPAVCSTRHVCLPAVISCTVSCWLPVSDIFNTELVPAHAAAAFRKNNLLCLVPCCYVDPLKVCLKDSSSCLPWASSFACLPSCCPLLPSGIFNKCMYCIAVLECRWVGCQLERAFCYYML